jgi:hypothetical protein
MSTETLPAPAATAESNDALDVPIITEPLEGMPVDAAYATFTWSTVAEAEGYAFQVARDESFSDLVVDLAVGDATMLTLFEAFKPDGAARYARVAAIREGRERPYSRITTFHPLSDSDYEQRTHRPTRRAPAAAEVARPLASPGRPDRAAVAAPPVAMQTSASDAMALAVVATILGVFLMLIVITLLA